MQRLQISLETGDREERWTDFKNRIGEEKDSKAFEELLDIGECYLNARNIEEELKRREEKEAIEDIRDLAIDDAASIHRRKEAIDLLKNFGDDAVPALAKIAKEGKDRSEALDALKEIKED